MNHRRRTDPLSATFGARSALAKDTVAAFCAALTKEFAGRPSGIAARLFETWRAQFGIVRVVAVRKADRRRANIAAWRRKWLGGPAADEDLFLFAVQCYAASLIKLWMSSLAPLALQHGETFSLWNQLESGEYWGPAGVCNLVAGDVYQAVALTRRKSVGAALSRLSETARDIPDSLPSASAMRCVVVGLVPRVVRHALGEHYTPGWLAEHVLELVHVGPSAAERVLDPMCGGGVFLTSILQRRRRSQASMASLLSGVAGIELHPLAVLLARASVLATLVAGGAALDAAHTSIPVHHGDAVLAALRRRESPSGVLTVLTPLGAIDAPDDDDAAAMIDRHLAAAGALGCGASLVADARGLAALSDFDVVVGNPPWVGWETLPAEERRRTESLWKEYGLFGQSGMAAILGGGKKDLSMLATYVAADVWLKRGGTLGFVLNESAFKSSGAARGFRRFQIGEGEFLRVLRVDDLTRINPFVDAATRTTVLVLRKGEPTSYPVPVVEWRKTHRREAAAEPAVAVDPQSAWLSASPAALPLLRRLLGRSAVRAYEGVNTGGANGVYWLASVEPNGHDSLIVENAADAGRSLLPRIRAEIEPLHVYPLLRHGDVGRWKAKPAISILLLQDTVRRQGFTIPELEATAPKTLAYVRHFEPMLKKRAAYRRYFNGNRSNGAEVPFYSMFNVGTYTLAPIKVVWRRMVARPEAAVIVAESDRPALPQETLCFIPCREADEAYFYAGLINSTPFAAAALATSQGSSKSFGSPHLLEVVRLPTFDSSSPAHRRLVLAARQGERGCEGDLDDAAAAVFGLNDDELAILASERDFLRSR